MEEPHGACWGGSGCNVSTVYPLLPGRCTRGGLSLSIKNSPSLQRRRGCSRRGRVYLGLVLQVCTVTSHVTRCSATLTVYTDTLQCLKCDLALGTSPLPLDTGARIVSEGGHYCHYGQLNHLTWCRVTYWLCAAPGLAPLPAPSSAQRNVFFSAVLLECSSPPRP